MSRRSLRPHLNQIRTWVQDGRTDAWIAHQLEVTGPEIESFRAQNGLGGADVVESPADLRAEDDESIAAELDELEAKRQEEAKRKAEEEAKRKAEEEAAEANGEGSSNRRRRGRSGRKGGTSSRNEFEGTFDHGGEGYGLWLDPAVVDSAVYAEHWAGQRQITVTILDDKIVITRAGEAIEDSTSNGKEASEDSTDGDNAEDSEKKPQRSRRRRNNRKPKSAEEAAPEGEVNEEAKDQSSQTGPAEESVSTDEAPVSDVTESSATSEPTSFGEPTNDVEPSQDAKSETQDAEPEAERPEPAEPVLAETNVESAEQEADSPKE